MIKGLHGLHLVVPGGIKVQLYEPKYTKAKKPAAPAAKKKKPTTAKSKPKPKKAKAKSRR